MATFTPARCFNHASREAAAFCFECRKPHCRECVTEHQGKVLCTSCLAQFVVEKKSDGQTLLYLAGSAGILVSLLTAMLVFMTLGKFLLEIPSDLHDGVWIEEGVIGEP